MKPRSLVILGLLSILALLANVFPSGLGGNTAAAEPQRLLVFTNGNAAVHAAARQALEEKGGRVRSITHVKQGLAFMDVLAPAAPGEALRRIAGMPGVVEISADQPPELMDDNLQWGVDRIDAECVWSASCVPGIGTSPRPVSAGSSSTGAGVRIAVVDTGIDMAHPDLTPNLASIGHANCVDTADDSCATSGYDFGDGDGHGTHVAGIVAAAGNGSGVVGVASGATLVSVKIFSNDGGGSFASVVSAIRYVAGTGAGARRADVMNMSFGWNKKDLERCRSCVTTLQTVINEAWAAGVVPVAAAGNAGNLKGTSDNIIYPARLSNVVAVGATDRYDKRASFSSTGSTLDIVAPGANIYSTYPGGGYATMSGTSMACPHAVGAAALVIQSLGTTWTPASVASKLASTADDLGSKGFDSQYGNGLLDAQQAVTGVESKP